MHLVSLIRLLFFLLKLWQGSEVRVLLLGMPTSAGSTMAEATCTHTCRRSASSVRR